ncbi:MAG: LacI family transcriptional regulator, partial [Solirubrobacteraceae bacterium]|nr:LacI family transcriptional regulator [Solirubrobacteraceae bacterium]
LDMVGAPLYVHRRLLTTLSDNVVTDRFGERAKEEAVRARAAPRPTMRDVADRAGVSLKTVSRVINGEIGVAARTAERVGVAIEELGFERNDLAASLRQGQSSGTLGLIIEDVANPFYSAVAQGVENAARDRGLMLITASAREDRERERELVAALMRRRVDAILMVPAGRDHRYLASARHHVPTVFVDRPPHNFDADTVLIDNAGGARRGGAHLIAHGHTRIAFVADEADLYTARERLAGYRQALAAAGVPEDPALVRTGNRSAAEAEDTVRRLLGLPPGERPTALLSANNRNTVGALRAMGRHGDRPAIVGFDDFELADVLGVTVMRSDPAELGERAAALAFARLDGHDGPPRSLTIPTTLIIRGSGEVKP